MMQGKVLAKLGQQFKGKLLLMKNDVLNKIIERDPAALDLAPKDRTIVHFMKSSSSGAPPKSTSQSIPGSSST